MTSEGRGGDRSNRWRGARLAIVAALCLAVLTGEAGCGPEAEPAAGCREPSFAWSSTQPPINLRHIFCGELEDGRARGLHATDLVETSPVIAGIDDRSEEGNGIYTAIVEFENGQRKLSTFFPDGCSASAIAASILHAATHPLRDHRRWGRIGPSAPGDGANGFCLDARGRSFEIRYAVRADGRINTAFPN